MNTPPPREPPREPLDAEERYLKRLLDSLPAADPGPGLDARILAQARRMPEQPAARRRFPGRWGLGAVAAAVLAVALWWPATRMPPAEPPAATERFETRTAAKSAVPEPGVPAKPRQDAPEASGERARAQSLDRIAEPAETGVLRDASPAGPAPAPAAAADEAGRSPADWIAEIERLRANGKVEQARDSLRRFRERYPEHPIPESLRGLLPERE